MKSNKLCFHRTIWYENFKYTFNLYCQIHDTLRNNEAQVICAMTQYQTCSLHNLLAIYLQVCLKINENLILFSADLRDPISSKRSSLKNEKLCWFHPIYSLDSLHHCVQYIPSIIYVFDLCETQRFLSLFPIKIQAPKRQGSLSIIKKLIVFCLKTMHQNNIWRSQ